MKYVMQDLPQAGDTVVVGLSGGVDSTVTAALLKQRGCHVIGVTMSLWDGHIPQIKGGRRTHDACYSPNEEEDIKQCKAFCEEHGIDYHVIDVSKAYNRIVLDYFTEEYRQGRTPNPCVRCNGLIKFGAMLDGVKNLGIRYDYFCTGHYAKVVRPETGLWGTDQKPCMIAAADDDFKDQSYFLCRLNSDLLENVRFPLAAFKKAQVFEIAKLAGLTAADKGESQDFIDAQYYDALFADKPSAPGNVIDTNGNVIGTHSGIEHYTIGQRKGFHVNTDNPLYVQSIDADNNTITVAPKECNNSDYLIASDFIWAGNIEPPQTFRAKVKIRLRTKAAWVTVSKDGDKYKLVFDEPQNAVTPGQFAVLYDENVILGSGIIVAKST